MAHYYGKLFLLEMVLPICLALSVIIRQTALSFVHLFFFFLLPIIKIPTPGYIAGSTLCYIHTLMILATVVVIAHCVYQIVLVFYSDIAAVETSMRYLGLVNFAKISFIDGLRFMTPDALIFLISIWIYIVWCRGSRSDESNSTYMMTSSIWFRSKWKYTIAQLGKAVTLVLLGITGMLKPAVLNGTYFLVFLGCMTWLACYHGLGYRFGVLLLCMQMYTALHLAGLLAVQMEFVQVYIQGVDKYFRYMGLIHLVEVDKTVPTVEHIISDDILVFFNPILILFLYYVISIEAKLLLQFQKTTMFRANHISLQTNMENQPDNENPNIRHTVSEYSDQMQGQVKVTIWGQIMNLFQVILGSSHIIMNFIMMIWSITYHSWLTFIFLLWAVFLWILPKHQSTMMQCSPFVVMYGEFLLVLQYLYGMDIIHEEFPQIQFVKQFQIGFLRAQEPVCIPLFIKTLYMFSFWITMREFKKKQFYEKSLLRPQNEPESSQTAERPSQLSRIKMKLVQNILTKFWIWIVIIMFILIGITRKTVTVFDIIYAALLLIFLLVFQISYKLWRKITYKFWMIVIGYSMIVLIMVYTYQFEAVPHYLGLIGISKVLQNVGLVKYDTSQLLLQLAKPTFFLIICEIQLQYFHDKFLVLTDPEMQRVLLKQESAKIDSDMGEQRSEKMTSPHFKIIRKLAQEEPSLTAKKIKNATASIFDFLYLFLELHASKIILLAIIVTCINKVCAMHFVFVVLAVIAILFGNNYCSRVLHFMSICIAVCIVSQMTYQLDIFKHENYDVLCQKNITGNDAIWIGLQKMEKGHSLAPLLKNYIAIFALYTFLALIKVWQKFKRISKGLSPKTPSVIFPKITRMHADENIKNCLKYLSNYGFFKFGVEICFMVTVSLIGYYESVGSIMYAAWLVIMLNLKRKYLVKIWRIFMVYIMVIIILQYGMAVSLPPTICYEPFWKDPTSLEKWIFYPARTDIPEIPKLFYDYLLLLLVSRQRIVFHTEKLYANTFYAGGNNRSILKELEKPGFVNPISDHITNPRSWLDPIKEIVLSRFLWLTLSAVFLTGSDRIYAMGYLLCAFSLFWKAELLFLYDVPQILKLWNILLAYNVGVILMISIINVLGCLFIKELKKHASWAVHMFDIKCNKEFELTFIYTDPVYDATICLHKSVGSGLISDQLCFCFLITMKRIFSSYYFLHHIHESKARSFLASRGADMIQHLKQKMLMLQEKKKLQTLEKIKDRMEYINKHMMPIKTNNHFIVVNSGDYYMFDHDFDVETVTEEKQSKEEETKHNRELLNFLNTALKMGITQAAQLALEGTLQHDQQQKALSDTTSGGKSSKEEDEDSSHKVPDTDSIYMMSEEKKTLGSKIWLGLKIIWALLEFIMVAITKRLNHISRDYQYTTQVLNYRKKIYIIKEAHETLQRIRVDDLNRRVPRYTILKEYEERLQHLELLLKKHQYHKSFTDEELLDMVHSTSDSTVQTEEDDEKEQEQVFKKSDHAPVIQLLIAIKYTIMCYSDLLCYFMVILYQIRNPSLLSLPLPLMILLWGTLTVPRPSKTFWISMILYTKIIVIIKWLFGFHLIQMNRPDDPLENPLFPPRIIGIEPHYDYALFELFLLLAFFFHRSTMKSMGLWKSSQEDSIVFKEKRKEFILIDKGDSVVLIPSDHYELSKTQISDVHVSFSGILTDEVDAEAIKDLSFHYAEYHKPEKIVSRAKGTEALEHLPEYISLVFQQYCSSITRFFRRLFKKRKHIDVDVYTLMFFCDFINFLVVIFGIQAFALDIEDREIFKYIQHSTVPIPFLTLLILQFCFIIIDRILYLRKLLVGKIIFQFLLVISMHIWMYFILPSLTRRQLKEEAATQIWYVIKCIYFLLSAYQIRSGYPNHSNRYFFCKNNGYLNLMLIKGFLTFPYLFELRGITDWMWTDTSLTLWEWLKTEEIFLQLYTIKYIRKLEKDYPQTRGVKMGLFFKYIIGGTFLFILLATIWSPLIVYALRGTVGIINIPAKASIKVEINNYEPIYEMQTSHLIGSMNKENWDLMKSTYIKNRDAIKFMSEYDPADVAVMRMDTTSKKYWYISAAALEHLREDILSDKRITIRFSWIITPTARYTTAATAVGEKEYTLPPATSDSSSIMRKQFLNLLNGSSDTTITVPYIMPKFLHVTQTGETKVLAYFMDRVVSKKENRFRSIALKLTKIGSEGNQWWEMNEICDDYNYYIYLKNIAPGSCTRLVIFTFSDRIFPEALIAFSNSGIIGLYVGYVLLLHRMVLSKIIRSAPEKIIYEDLPSVDRMLQVCDDLYLVREYNLFDLEEEIYAKLIFLYRSPEMRIKYTRHHLQIAMQNSSNEARPLTD